MQPTPSTDLLAKLYSSGAYLPLAIVLAFLGITWASKHIAWLQATNRVHYVSAGLTGLAVLVGPATQGTTPNLSMWLAAVGTIVALVLPGATPKGEEPQPVTIDLTNKPPQSGFARLGVMVAIAAIGGALLFGCGGADRQKTLGYALATTTAITADITTQNDALIQADITGRATSQAAGTAALAKYRAARAKVVADMPIVLDAIGAAYQLNDDASLKNAETALATLLSDVVAMKGAH